MTQPEPYPDLAWLQSIRDQCETGRLSTEFPYTSLEMLRLLDHIGTQAARIEALETALDEAGDVLLEVVPGTDGRWVSKRDVILGKIDALLTSPSQEAQP